MPQKVTQNFLLKKMKLKKEFETAIKERNFKKEEIKKIKLALNELEKEKRLENNFKIGNYLTKSNLSFETILSGLLYGIEEYLPKEKIEKLFGEEIENLILEQKKFKEIKKKSEKKKDNPLKKILITNISDIRIIFIELASKLVELENQKKTKEQKKLAKEILEFYAPLSGRLGLELIKKEMNDLAFKIQNPKKYREIVKFLKMSKEKREKFIEEILAEFENLLKNKIKILKIKGRDKQIYSIYQKIVKRKVPLNEQNDHYAIRIITDSVENCYNAINLIKDKYEEIPKTYKDYIKNPKPNGYQSLHITIKTNLRVLEVQVRTAKMDADAEEGNAAHFAYKNEGEGKDFEKRLSWLKEIFEMKNTSAKEKTKINLFKDKIYCFTPKGEAFEMPVNSSALDFAYRIHADVGNKAIGAKINKKFAPLKTKIKNGDKIEIITSKFQRPRRDWIKFVLTEKAKKIISREVKKIEKIPVSKKRLLEEENKEKIENIVKLESLPNHHVQFAKCCFPIPPEKIIGTIKSNKNILVHAKNCKWIKDSKNSQLELEWKKEYSYPIKMNVLSKDRSGLLTDLLNTITRRKIEILEANAKIVENSMAQCSFKLKIENLEKLLEIIKRIKKIKGVEKIFFE